MNHIEKLRHDLSTKSMKYLGFDLNDYPQRSPEWHKSRLGVITGSESNNLIKDGRKKGSKSESYYTYMHTLIAEIATGSTNEANSASLEWGRFQEDNAKSVYEFEYNCNVDEITFIYSDDMRCGSSLDGFVVSKNKGMEIKCPYNSKHHIDFLLFGKDVIDKDYIAQVQFNMRISKIDCFDFISFDPRFSRTPIGLCEMTLDKEIQDKFDERIPEFIDEMNHKLEILGIEFGSQWRV